jgi:hypothetical protein
VQRRQPPVQDQHAISAATYMTFSERKTYRPLADPRKASWQSLTFPLRKESGPGHMATNKRGVNTIATDPSDRPHNYKNASFHVRNINHVYFDCRCYYTNLNFEDWFITIPLYISTIYTPKSTDIYQSRYSCPFHIQHGSRTTFEAKTCLQAKASPKARCTPASPTPTASLQAP